MEDVPEQTIGQKRNENGNYHPDLKGNENWQNNAKGKGFYVIGDYLMRRKIT